MSDKRSDKASTTSISNENIAALSYEEAHAALEDVLTALEAGDLPLEEAMARYEMGARLSQHCIKKLEEAELRVRQWQPDGTGDWSNASEVEVEEW